MYRYKRGVKVSYDRQGYIYFVSRMYRELPLADQDKIRELCIKSGGEYHKALFDFVTTDTTATAIEQKYFIGKSTLYRAVKKYYENFPEKL